MANVLQPRMDAHRYNFRYAEIVHLQHHLGMARGRFQGDGLAVFADDGRENATAQAWGAAGPRTPDGANPIDDRHSFDMTVPR